MIAGSPFSALTGAVYLEELFSHRYICVRYIASYSFGNGGLDVLFEHKVIYERTLKFLNGPRISFYIYYSNFFNCGKKKKKGACMYYLFWNSLRFLLQPKSIFVYIYKYHIITRM